jgi:hypothetical protein
VECVSLSAVARLELFGVDAAQAAVDSLPSAVRFDALEDRRRCRLSDSRARCGMIGERDTHHGKQGRGGRYRFGWFGRWGRKSERGAGWMALEVRKWARRGGRRLPRGLG